MMPTIPLRFMEPVVVEPLVVLLFLVVVAVVEVM
jgi:hypothetical protein